MVYFQLKLTSLYKRFYFKFLLAIYGSDETVNLLIDAGAEIKTINSDGITSLMTGKFLNKFWS